ncbi:MAG: redoxin domain-containing protein [Planctomycetota bacterium]
MKALKPFVALTAGLALAVGVVMISQQQPAQAVSASPTAAGLPEAPAFTLTDTNGTQHSLADFHGKYVVLEWINDGCPFVKKFYEPGKMQELQQAYAERGVVWLAIASSSPGNQGHHTAAGWNQVIDDWGINAAAILLDEDGSVGRAYDAKVTPHMYVINPDGKLIYNGAIDSVRSTDPGDISSAENYVTKVLDAALLQNTTPYGCSVKY